MSQNLKSKKAITPVVATALLLVVVTVAVVGFQTWFQDYSSGMLSNLEIQTNSGVGANNLQLLSLVDKTLYIQNNYNTNFSNYTLKINDKNCNISSNISIGTHGYDISSCLDKLTTSTPTITLITTKTIVSKSFYVSGVSSLSAALSSCTLSNITKPSGSNYTFYLDSLPAGTSCQQETRVCNNGIFSGNISYIFNDCFNGCSQSGINLVSGSNYTFYNLGVVPYGNTCNNYKQIRSCDNGSLSGNYTYVSCSVQGQDINPTPFSFTNQTGVNFSTIVMSNTVTPSGFNGVINLGISGAGSPQFSVNGSAWTTSGNITLGENITLRMNSSGSALTTGIVTLTFGTNYSVNWSVTTRDFYNCLAVGGIQLNNSQSANFYSTSSPSGQLCSAVSQTRTCNDGTLSGNSSYSFGSCLSGCSLNGVSLSNSQSATFYNSNTGVICYPQTRTCNDGTLSGTSSYQYNTCSPICSGLPNGKWIAVPGNSALGTSDFCVMKYDAKFANLNNKTQDFLYKTWAYNTALGNLSITSTPTPEPITSINQTDARAACAALGSHYHLITDAEWTTIGRNAENVSSNWNSSKVGIGFMYSGHNDNNPDYALNASSNDANGYYEINDSNKTQRRTLTLSDGQVIWDLAGNIDEWTNDTCNTASWYSYQGWVEWNSTNFIGNEKALAGPFGDYTSKNGMGEYYGCGGNGYGFENGGGWYIGSYGGVFYVTMNLPSSNTASVLGFRCSYTP